ncbi:hypothetical protein TI39_contig351g00008 [Lecanosticta acicola]|uniref:F-box domain-containing protein n=1 Tax=Lecanosticta acicola TaxID=111012 RepID=A0AAI8W1M3_9PEZI|nr:hypothetical protein TI39_contig351g00008 [Lecanosticta acicola]
MTTPTLIGIPPEVFERIAQLSDDADLLAIRLVCREAASKVLRTYTEVHFSRRHIYLHRESDLRAAIPVAKHPVFGAALSELVINVDQLQDPATSVMVDRSLSEEARLERADQLNAIFQKQEQLKDISTHLQLLTIVFAHTRRHGNHPVVTVDSDPPELRANLDTCGLYIAWENTDHHKSLLVILEALALSGVKPSAFEMVDAEEQINLNTLVQKDLHIFREALDGTSKVVLNIKFDNKDGGSVVDHGAWKFFEVIASNLALTHLDLFEAPNDLPLGQSSVLRHVLDQRFRLLKKLVLRRACLRASALLNFIQQTPQLEHLSLVDLELIQHATHSLCAEGKGLEAAIQQRTHLSRVEVSGFVWEQNI